MPANNFLPFALDVGANVMSQADYDALAQRTSGFLSGVALSDQLNKVWRQSSFMTAALAKAMFDELGVDLLDDGDLAAMATLIDAYVAAVGGGGGGGGVAWGGVQTANFAAVANTRYFMDTAAGSITATLPGGTPALGAYIEFGCNGATNNGIIGRNGNLIQGSASNLTINSDAVAPGLTWVGGSIGWQVQP